MKKRISIAALFVAMFAGGCTHDDLFARLAGITDHIRLVRTDAAFFGAALVLELEENPFGSLQLLN